MAHLPLIFFPHELLHQKAELVTVFDGELEKFAQDLYETLHHEQGLGITAPHVGVLKQITVIELEKDQPQFFINPIILSASDTFATYTEGSLSMPGIREDIARPAHIRVRFQNLKGDYFENDYNDFLSTCLQHEIDQLNGIFWLQRLSKLKRDRAIKRYKKLSTR